MHFSAQFYHPLHQTMPGAAEVPGTSQGLSIPGEVPPFHFQPRRAALDWRRFGALDVERVAREVDVASLQEHISTMAFCSLEGERCPHCGQPADPVLLKVLRMAQLSIEYLLHCQESLGTSLAAHAQRLRDAHAELARAQQQVAEQALQLRGAKEESRGWKKLIATQQLLLQAGPNLCYQCHLCAKAFRSSSFLQAHLQRRHVEATEAARQSLKEVEQMEEEMEKLKVKLQEVQQQLEAEKEAKKLCREQEMERAHQREEEGKKDLERWKEEERTKLREEMDGLRRLLLGVVKDVASRSNAMEGKLQELQAREVVESSLGTLQDGDTEETEWWAPKQAELQGKQEKMALQLKKENKPLRTIPSQDQQAATDHVHQQMDALSPHLGDLPKLTKSQEKVKLLSASKAKVTKLLAAEESPKRRRVPPSPSPGLSPRITALAPAPTFTPGREETTQGGKQRLLAALRRTPNLLKQFRSIQEELLEEKLESMGVKRVGRGISTRTYQSLQALIRLQRQQKAKKFPGLLLLRDELVQAVMGEVKRLKKPCSARHLSILPAQSPKKSLRRSQPKVLPAAAEPDALVVPQPTPRSRALSIQSPLKSPWGTLQTSKPSSLQRGLVQHQSSEAMLGEKQLTPSSTGLSPEQESSTVVLGHESDSDRSDLGLLEETSGSATSMVLRLLERHLAAVAQRPSSRVKLFPAASSASPKTSQPTKKLQFAGDSSDLETSSQEELA